MSTTRQPHPARDGGDAQDQPCEADALCRLLAAAAPPRHVRDGSRELRGEADAAAAFREAHLRAKPASRWRPTGTGRLLALKAAIAVAGLSGASVALAAATGNLPAQLGGGRPEAPAVSSSSVPGKGLVQGSRLIAPPSPAVRGLCEAYAGAGSNPGTALDAPAITRLAAAAGGGDKVPSYCAAVLATPDPGHAATHAAGSPGAGSPGRAGKPARHPAPHPSSGAAADSQGNSGTGNSYTGGADPGNSNGGNSYSGGPNAGQGSDNPSPTATEQPTGKPSLHP